MASHVLEELGEPAPGMVRDICFRPNRGFARLMQSPAKLLLGVRAMFVMGTAYTIVIALHAVANAQVTTAPWLAIPASNYYYWAVFFTAPAMVGGWILAAGVVQLLGREVNGEGSFEETASALALAFAIPSWVTLSVDFVLGSLFALKLLPQEQWLEATARPGVGQTFVLGYLLLQALWLMWLVPSAISNAKKTHGTATALLSLAALLPYAAVLAVFVR